MDVCFAGTRSLNYGIVFFQRAMDVEVNVSGKGRALASSDEEEDPGVQDLFSPQVNCAEGSDVEENLGDVKDHDGDDGVGTGMDLLEEEEDVEDEEDYCPGGYHRISPGDLLIDE